MKLINFLFGCTHKHLTWPQGRGRQCYVVCLDCGQEFAYDWKQMKVVTSVEQVGKERRIA